jgi:hypothetical protein
MKKWWIGAALAAMCVGQSARAQYPAGDGGPLPEPAPVAPCPPQGQRFMPGPLTGASAPFGPGDALSLPASIPTAWGRGPVPESGAFLSLGGMALRRQAPGHRTYVTDDGREVLNTHFIDPAFQPGGRLTFGYLCDDAAIELTGFYLPDYTKSVSAEHGGRLNGPFVNPPAGFGGANGTSLWLGADADTLSLQSALGDAELNYRWWPRSYTGLEGIIGFRYVELDERGRLFTNGGLTTQAMTGMQDPTLQATYTARVHNHMLMPQIGSEWNLMPFPWMSVGVITKAAFGADSVDIVTRLQRGDAQAGFEERHNHWTYTSLYEIDAFIDVVWLERLRLRAGWTLLWALHVNEAFQQVNFDLSVPAQSRRDSGSIFYHGPMVELEFLY